MNHKSLAIIIVIHHRNYHGHQLKPVRKYTIRRTGGVGHCFACSVLVLCELFFIMSRMFFWQSYPLEPNFLVWTHWHRVRSKIVKIINIWEAEHLKYHRPQSGVNFFFFWYLSVTRLVDSGVMIVNWMSAQKWPVIFTTKMCDVFQPLKYFSNFLHFYLSLYQKFSRKHPILRQLIPNCLSARRVRFGFQSTNWNRFHHSTMGSMIDSDL